MSQTKAKGKSNLGLGTVPVEDQMTDKFDDGAAN